MGACGGASKKTENPIFFVQNSNFKNTLQQFHRSEIILLKLIYKDLAQRNGERLIPRECFSNFFNMIGLWSELVFDHFLKQEKNIGIGYEEFIEGIAYYTKCEQQQKIQHLYNIYSKNGQGGIHREDFLQMLLNYPREQLQSLFDDQAFLEDQKILKMHEEHLIKQKKQKDTPQQQKAGSSSFQDVDLLPLRQSSANKIQPSHSGGAAIESMKMSIQIESVDMMFPSQNMIALNGVPIGTMGCNLKLNVNGKEIELQQVNINYMAKKYVEMIFKGCIKQRNEGATSIGERKQQQVSDNQPQIIGEQQTEILSLCEFTQFVTLHPLLLNALYKGFNYQIWGVDSHNGALMFLNEEKEYSGILQVPKHTKNKKTIYYQDRFCELQNHFLIVRRKQDIFPKKIICLDGLLVKGLNEQNKMGFMIFHKDQIYKPKKFYCNDQMEYRTWIDRMSIFQKASIEDHYIMQQKLGDGRFSVVYKGTSKKTQAVVAIKVIEKFRLTKEEKTFLGHETEIMKLLHHPCIVQLYEVLETKTHMYIVTELATHGELFELISDKKRLQEPEASLIIGQLIDAVHYIHTLGIVHRDLKPENIMIVKDENERIKQIKLIDFGFANYLTNLQNEDNSRICGTTNYLAPEMLQGQKFDFKIDNFSIGVIMYFCLVGKLPFDSEFADEIIRNIIDCHFDLDESPWDLISEDAKDLVCAFLQKDPKDRIKLTEAMSHKWIKQRDRNRKLSKLKQT